MKTDRPQTLRLLSRNEAETLAVGRAIGGLLRAGDVVAIDGELGAGKTRLVRGLALGMGLDGSLVSSPTYVLINEYVGVSEGGGSTASSEWALEMGDEPFGPAARLFHVDAYRLTGPADLDSLGWDRVMDPASRAVVAIEWASRIAPALAWEACRVVMEVGAQRPRNADDAGADQGERLMGIDAPPGWRLREGWREVVRLGMLLSSDRPLSEEQRGRAPLPRGWGRCPITRRPVPPDAPTFPFADERARLIDLGRWASGAYTLGRDLLPEDEAEQDFGGG